MKKIKINKEAISEILVADTDQVPDSEASDVEDKLGEGGGGGVEGGEGEVGGEKERGRGGGEGRGEK